MRFDGTARDRAQELLVFADGFDDAGHLGLATRSRVVARDMLRLIDDLEAERSARQSVQAQRDRAIELLARRAYDAIQS